MTRRGALLPGALAELPEALAAADFDGPTLVSIGDVVGLAEQAEIVERLAA